MLDKLSPLATSYESFAVSESNNTNFTPCNPLASKLHAALINPPDLTSSDGFRVTPPLGLGYIASVARLAGYHVDIFDFVLELDLTDEFLLKCGLFDSYRVYGLSTYSDTFLQTIKLCRCIKSHRPDALIVLGGYHATAVGQDILQDFPEVDLVIRNEGEETFSEILNAVLEGYEFKLISGISWRNTNGLIIRNADRINLIDQDNIPYPVVSPRYKPQYIHFAHAKSREIKKTVSIVSSRGCPKRCSFCSIIVMNPKWRARSVDSLMSEVRYRYAQEPFQHILFQDANFFVSVLRTRDFSKALYNFNPKITWSGTATADQVVRHADVLYEIGHLNCAYLEIGIESGNKGSLARFNKGTSVKINEEALEILERAEINLGLDFIMFEPEMTLPDLIENFEFLVRNDLIGYWPVDILFNELRLFPATPIREKYEKLLQTTFSPHEVPDTPFFDPAVNTVVRCMNTYLERHQYSTNYLIKALSKAVNIVVFTSHQEIVFDSSLVNLCQKIFATIVRLRHLPYNFMACLLAQPNCLSSKLTFDEIVEYIEIDMSAEHSLREMGERLLLELKCKVIARNSEFSKIKQ